MISARYEQGQRNYEMLSARYEDMLEKREKLLEASGGELRLGVSSSVVVDIVGAECSLL